VPAAPVTFAVYAGIALLANLPDWPGDPNHIPSGDLDQMVWFLSWTPHAILHWQNPLATTWLNYPEGVNLAQNTSVPLLALLAAPLTLAVSPVASLNLLLWLAFPLSALSMFYVLRRWVGWGIAAFVGGALYGFSPYVVTQDVHHLNLAFVPLPPLILLCAYEMIRPGTQRPIRWGVAFGAALVAQFFISSEVAATSMLVVVLSAVVLGVANPRAVASAYRRSARAAAAAVGVVAAAIAYPTWMMIEGPFRYRGPAYRSGFSADLVSSIAPTKMQKFVPARLAAVDSHHLVSGNASENGLYLGIPLILLLLVLVVLCWKNRWIRFAGLMALIMSVLSLGPHLVVDNHMTSIPLPWDLLRHLPLANNVIVARLSLYTMLFSVVVVAVGMQELRVRWTLPHAPPWGATRSVFDPTRVRLVSIAVIGTLGIASALSLVPAWPLKTPPAAVPAFFASAEVNRIPYGSVVLISPYPSQVEVQAQMWQAVANMRFRIIGGFALVRTTAGSSSDYPDILTPEPVQRFLWAKATGGRPYPAGRVPSDDPELLCEVRSFLLRYRVGTVIWTSHDAQPGVIDALYDRAIGPPNYVGGGADVWFGVPDLVQARIRSCTT
jgi:hypothetical protein